VWIRSGRDAGVNIRLVGEDVRAGSLVLDEGTPLGAAGIGVLASLAVAHPVVYRRPRVAILGSGDEIVDIDRTDEIRSGRKVASSNTHTLVALVTQAGGIPVNLGIASDTQESMREHLGRASDCDLIVTTAGISVGDHDYVLSTLREMGLELKFWKTPDATGSASRLRAPARHPVCPPARLPMDRAAGQSGKYHGDLRALRASRDPENDGPQPAFPRTHHRNPRGADQAGTQTAAFSSSRGH
jgi:molybdopterin biosynthesis enzyme